MSLFSRESSFTRNTAIVVLGSFLLIEGAPALAAAAEEKPRTNFAIMKSACEEAAAEIAKDVAGEIGGASVMIVKAKGIGDADFLFENALVETLREGGARTIVGGKQPASPADSAGYALSYQIVRLGVRYPEISRRWWFGSKMVERAVNVDVTAQLVSRETGNVVWIREGSGVYGDTIVYSDLESVEEAMYEFTQPPRNEFKMSRIIEPVVVTGIVVALVYLFFSNQSNE